MKKLIFVTLAVALALALFGCGDDPVPALPHDQTPTSADYNINGKWTQPVYNITPINITPKANKSSGSITVCYNGSTTLPDTDGTYAVTFDVATASGWNAAAGLRAGTLTITDGFTNGPDFATWLNGKAANTAADPYTVKLNITNTSDFTSIKTALVNNKNKYVNLDLSGSTITTIPQLALCTDSGSNVYTPCYTLVGIIIPNSVVSIGEHAFTFSSLTSVTIPSSVKSIERGAFVCESLTSVTFEGTIPWSGFSNLFMNEVFLGDLRDKFYATDEDNGTPGTYTTTTAPTTSYSKWTLQ